MGTIILVISFLMVPHESLTEDTPGDSSSSSSSSSSDEDDDSDIGDNDKKDKKTIWSDKYVQGLQKKIEVQEKVFGNR
jgi:hypothetical protein